MIVTPINHVTAIYERQFAVRFCARRERDVDHLCYERARTPIPTAATPARSHR